MKNDGPSGENRITGGDHSWIVLVHMLACSQKGGKASKSQGALLTQREESRDHRLVVIFGRGGGIKCIH